MDQAERELEVGDLLPRLARKVAVTDDGHWLWTGEVDRNGYPVASYEGRPRYAHRVVRHMTCGDITVTAARDKSDYLANTCGVRLCVHPAHHVVRDHAAFLRQGYRLREAAK